MARLINNIVSCRAPLESTEGRSRETAVRVGGKSQRNRLATVVANCSIALCLRFEVPGIDISPVFFLPLFEGDSGNTVGSW